MFFQKKKERESSMSGGDGGDKRTPKKDKKKVEIPLSKEDMARLEETKNRLFGDSSSKKIPKFNYQPPPSPPVDVDDHHFHPLKTFHLPGLRLPVLARVTLAERTLTLHRTAVGDFGFSLRRAQLLEYNHDVEQRRTVIFAEPLHNAKDAQMDTGLLPGDQLLQVNGTEVLSLSRDDVVQLIRESGPTVTLVVRPVPELSELTMRHKQRSSATTILLDDQQQVLLGASTSKTSNHLPITQMNTRGDVWLAHSGGYTPAVIIADTGDQIRIRLLTSDEELLVDSDDIDKANPVELDRVEDISQLMYINESSTLHLLRQRYGSNLIHTHAGSTSTVIINPINQLSFYHEKIVHMFKGCKRMDMPPHIYAVAQQVYRNMQLSSGAQSVVFTGASGSGKSSQMRHFLHYLCVTAGGRSAISIEKLNATIGLLEAFGQCRTSLNQNASRFATVFTLEFDRATVVRSASVHALLLESMRVIRRPPHESNFHVFYYLWEGARDMNDRLHLDTIADPTPIISPLKRAADIDVARAGWTRLGTALTTIGVTIDEQQVLWSLLAALFHLAAAESTRETIAYRAQFVRASHAQRAGALLGVSVDELHAAVFRAKTDEHKRTDTTSNSCATTAVDGDKKSKTPTSFRDSLSRINITERTGDGVSALNAFIVGLYQETFNVLISFINRCLSSNTASGTSITLIDCPGMQNPASIPSKHHDVKQLSCAANLSDLIYNYANERIHQLFYASSFTNPIDIYRREQVDVDCSMPTVSPSTMVDLLDKPAQQQLLNQTDIDLRSREKRGLLWLLDEESIFPAASDESFLERLFVHYGDCRNQLYRVSGQTNRIVLRHCLGTNSVTYDVSGWLAQAQEKAVTRTILPLLQESHNASISSLFLNLRSYGLPGVSTAIETTSSSALRRVTTVIKSSPQTLKRRSFCALAKMQMDYIIESARRVNRIHFVHCLLPHADAGLGIAPSTTVDDLTNENNALINVPLLRQQIRAIQLVDSVRANKRGYPERMPFGEFKRRFACLLPNDVTLADALDDRIAVKGLLDSLDIDQNRYRLGISQLLLRHDILAQLEDRRDEILSGMIIRLQTHCRGYLARRRLAHRKVQELAIRCIQSNASKYMRVKNWPWWRLYTRVLPMINVHRTDEQLKERAEAIAELVAKIERLEKLCAELRANANRSEMMLAEMRNELAGERAINEKLADHLEQETGARTRLEKDVGELVTRATNAERKVQKLQMEVMDGRNRQLAMHVDSQDVNSTDALKQKQIERDRIDIDEERRSIEKLYETKLADATKQIEILTESEAAMKRKTQKTLADQQDVDMHVQKLNQRNAELEKKQLEFDTELKKAQAATLVERTKYERVSHEREELLAKMYRLESAFKELTDEKVDLEAKLKATQCELDDVTQTVVGRTGNSDAVELISMRHECREAKLKIAEQEEELDDMAGNVEKLQKSITDLQMKAERMRCEHARELDAKEQEMDEQRALHQRRIRDMELQLQDETDEKRTLLKQKRDLELRLRRSQEERTHRDENNSVELQLRRDLRKTTGLLNDAHVLLAQYRDHAPQSAQLKQLRNQLEDAEFARLAAIKSKQAIEAELQDVRGQLETMTAARQLADDRCITLLKEKNTAHLLVDEHDDELDELLRKYRALVAQAGIDSIRINDQTQQIADLELDKERLVEQLNELHSRQQWHETHTVDRHKVELAQQKIRDLEARLDLETTQKVRLESLVNKTKDELETAHTELADLRACRERELEIGRKSKKDMIHLQEQLYDAQTHEAELALKSQELERQLANAEQELVTTQTDLKLAMRRIDGLQAVLQDGLDDNDDDVEDDGEEETSIDGERRLTNGSATTW